MLKYTEKNSRCH